jgi:hypothetical protein
MIGKKWTLKKPVRYFFPTGKKPDGLVAIPSFASSV